MKTVYKYELPLEDKFGIEMPSGASILWVDEQYNKPCLWAYVDPEVHKEVRHFRLAGTGHPIDDSEDVLWHMGTVKLNNGALVFHLFEIAEQPF